MVEKGEQRVKQQQHSSSSNCSKAGVFVLVQHRGTVVVVVVVVVVYDGQHHMEPRKRYATNVASGYLTRRKYKDRLDINMKTQAVNTFPSSIVSSTGNELTDRIVYVTSSKSMRMM